MLTTAKIVEALNKYDLCLSDYYACAEGSVCAPQTLYDEILVRVSVDSDFTEDDLYEAFLDFHAMIKEGHYVKVENV